MWGWWRSTLRERERTRPQVDISRGDEFLMGRPSVRRSPTCRRKFKLERIPDYLRETVDWIIGGDRQGVNVVTHRGLAASGRSQVAPFAGWDDGVPSFVSLTLLVYYAAGVGYCVIRRF
ncbi:hypothetical protein Q1695_001186 [Nippostrongylus brasiliensis]|nr:hypothetical protein Q1695_001186 [Nippostrongylus brasiliensis]